MSKCRFNKCNNDVTGKAKYCSPKCKQAAYRNKRNTENVTDKPESVTVEPKSDKAKLGVISTMTANVPYPDTRVSVRVDKPRAADPNVQAIWDRRNAQGQAAGYDNEATDQDYPQAQRPHHSPEPALAGQTQEAG